MAQTLGQIFTGGQIGPRALLPTAPTPNARQKCFSAIANQLKRGPFYAAPTKADIKGMRKGRPWIIRFDPDIDQDVTIVFDLQPVRGSAGMASLTNTRTVGVNGKQKEIYWQNGLVAFFPTPTKATSFCNVMMPPDKPGGPKIPRHFYLNTPSVVNVYAESQFLDPQRDFLTGPADTLTFNAGMITGHKHTGQSPAKTIVDTVTAPIRAMIPSVQLQQNTSVVSVPGKPDQTTTSTTTTTTAPKSP